MTVLTGSAHDASGVNRAARVQFRSENRFHVIYAPHGVRGAEALAAAVMQSLVAEGPTVIEAVVDSDHSVDAGYE